MIKKYTGRLIIMSVSLLVCSFCHFVWKKVLLLSDIIERIGSVGKDNFNITEFTDRLTLLSSPSGFASLHKLSLSVLVPIEIICGIVGIIFTLDRFKKYNILPAVFGAIVSVLGVVSFVLFVISGSAAVITILLLLLTLVVIPVLFFVFALKFFLGK